MVKNDNSVRLTNKKRFRWWWLLLVLALAIAAGIYWWRQPATMHVVACIPGDRNNDIGCWTPLGLCCWSWTEQAKSPSTITQYGWDGKPLWSVRAPAGVGEMGWRERDFACSPDGHIAAVCLLEDKQVHVLSWRDGRALGEVYLPYEKVIYTFSVEENMHVANSGRVWLYNDGMPYCPISAIDGSHIATGRLSMPRSINNHTIPHLAGVGPSLNEWELSSDGSLMAGQQDDVSMSCYFTLVVQDNYLIVGW